MKKYINSFDIDGVINLGEFLGVFPGPNDVIITGRSIEEYTETIKMLHERGIHNQVFFNPIKFINKTRKSSGLHKASIICALKRSGIDHGVHFEDDNVQIDMIHSIDSTIRVVHFVHDLVEKENVRHK